VYKEEELEVLPLFDFRLPITQLDTVQISFSKVYYSHEFLRNVSLAKQRMGYLTGLPKKTVYRNNAPSLIEQKKEYD